MSDKRSIDKQYLLQTLRDFDKEILSKKYNNSSVSKGDPGENGITPHIGDNGNWFIGEVDTNVPTSGKDGKSISKIILDDNNNLIITFSDGSTKNIGSLSMNIEADFLTNQGFGNLRFYNGKFQSFDGTNWNDISVGPENSFVINMVPKEMKHICGLYDHTIGYYKLMFEEPDDTIIDGQIACVVEKVVIRRKLNSDPVDENDGDLVITIIKPNFGTYKDSWYVDESFSPNMGENWFYKAFPISTTELANLSILNSTGKMTVKDHFLYGFVIDQNESNSDSMLSYIEDNTKFKSAYMDYTSDQFNYGTWKDAFFMPKPCMLHYDGTVAYYLDPNDYDLKEDGTPSDVANVDFDGNAMLQWTKIYWKIVDNRDNTANITFSDKKIDQDYHCWSNIDQNGDEIPYWYEAIYNGFYDGTRLRSLSSFTPTTGKTGEENISQAKMNNLPEDEFWMIDTFSGVQIRALLEYLISNSTNGRVFFGTGNANGESSASAVKKTGIMNKKGMFWGDTVGKTGVKVFGKEHPWGNIWQRCVGWINDKGITKIKMTHGQQDGSTVDDYNVTGDGYIEIPDSTPTGSVSGYLSACKFTEYGLFPVRNTGSATTKYCCGFSFNNTSVNMIYFGGRTGSTTKCGIFFMDYSSQQTYGEWTICANLTCRPTLAIQSGGDKT